MEVANLQVVVSSEVADALAGLRSVQREVKDVASVSDIELKKMGTATKTTGSGVLEETKKVEGFLGKWKMGWIAVGVAAIASLYAVAKSSAVISMYFAEFGMIIGSVFDEIGIAMAPVIDPLLDFLWKLADHFATLPAPIKLATGIIISAAAAFMTLVGAIALVKSVFAAAGLSGLFTGLAAKISIAGMGAAASISVFAGIAAIAVGAAHGYYVTWKDAWDKMGAAPGSAWAYMKTSLMTMFGVGGIPIYLAASIADLLGYGDQFQASLDRILIRWIRFWLDLTVEVGAGWPRLALSLSTILSGLWAWAQGAYSAGAELVNSLIRGIGDIGSRVWNHIRASLSTVENNLWNWVSGLTGFSPTLLELGRQIPLSLVRGASEIALDARAFAPVVAPAVTPGAYPGTFASSAVARPLTPTEINISMPVTITAAIRSETDLRDIARKLKEELKRELKDYVRYA